jgi:DNA-binding NarL/FixJ family response regulator
VLTRREREVAELIASGKDNRAVADALSVSKKTVEKYLTSIYLKLGLTSRAQLAAFMVSAGGRTAALTDVAVLREERA